MTKREAKAKKAGKEEKEARAEEKGKEEAPTRIEETEEEFLTREFPISLVNEVKRVSMEHKLSEDRMLELALKVKERYEKSLAEPGEAVGMITSQSMGEPGTQLVLRTKHFAGAAEVSVGSEIQRVEEIVDGRSKAKYPSMTIYLNEELKSDEAKARKFMKSLPDIRLEDLIAIKEDFKGKTITIEVDEEKLKEYEIALEEIIKIVEKTTAGKVRQGAGKKKLELTVDFPKTPLIKIRKTVNKLYVTRVQGVRGIEKTVLSEKDGEYVIKTTGSNFKAVLKLKEIDPNRTITNDIKEVAKVLGIEAGRMAIINELKPILGDTIKLDVRHLILLADAMTFMGEIQGIVRTGINREKASPFARATFEQTIKHLLDASFENQRENLNGVVENIIVGQPVKVGTGLVRLVMK